MGHYIDLGLSTMQLETAQAQCETSQQENDPSTQDVVNEFTRRSCRFREINGRPFVTLSYAQSLDGCLSARFGETLALSGPEALVLTHRLRAAHDAILVGIGTVFSDDPQLTVRKVAGRSPQAVVLDSQLRIPADCKLVRGGAGRLNVAVVETSDPRRRQMLESSGIHVIPTPSTPEGMVDIANVLRRLADMGIRSVMVEGGVRVIRSFLDTRLVDFLVVTVVPRFIGGGPSVRLQSQLLAGPSMDQFSHFRLGNDLALYGAPLWAASTPVEDRRVAAKKP
jgi:3,4-dihydroxy 2-butanone 4-phosphate synthase/GTP cyclohydrolase II